MRNSESNARICLPWVWRSSWRRSVTTGQYMCQRREAHLRDGTRFSEGDLERGCGCVGCIYTIFMRCRPVVAQQQCTLSLRRNQRRRMHTVRTPTTSRVLTSHQHPTMRYSEKRMQVMVEVNESRTEECFPLLLDRVFPLGGSSCATRPMVDRPALFGVTSRKPFVKAT